MGVKRGGGGAHIAPTHFTFNEIPTVPISNGSITTNANVLRKMGSGFESRERKFAGVRDKPRDVSRGLISRKTHRRIPRSDENKGFRVFRLSRD